MWLQPRPDVRMASTTICVSTSPCQSTLPCVYRPLDTAFIDHYRGPVAGPYLTACLHYYQDSCWPPTAAALVQHRVQDVLDCVCIQVHKLRMCLQRWVTIIRFWVIRTMFVVFSALSMTSQLSVV